MEEKEFKIRFLEESIPSLYVKKKETAINVIQELIQKNCVFGVDTETCSKEQYMHLNEAALSPHTGHVRLLQVYDGEKSFLFDYRYIPSDIFKEFLETKRFVAHNALFDLCFLKSSGVSSMDIGCTYIAMVLLLHAKFPTDVGLGASLSAAIKMIFKEDILKVMQTSDWSAPELTFEQIQYAALDPVCTLKLAQKFSPALEQKDLVKVYSLYKEAQHPIAEMQLNGMGFDKEKHTYLIDKWRRLLLEARGIALKETGLQEITPKKVAAWLSENLPPDLLSIWPKTPGGSLSTDKNAFKEFMHIPVLKPLLEFSKYETLLSTFGTTLANYVNEKTARIHPSYNIAGARTGRMSCKKPNLQNQPAERTEKEFRSIFLPHSGNKMIAADFSQIEVRVAAEVSQDKAMLAIYKNGQDIYKETARKVLNKKEITSLERQQMKAVVLGRLFGLGAAKFVHYAKSQYGLDVTEKEAYDFIAGFKEAFPEFAKWQIDQGARCEKSLKAKTIFGKIRALAKDNYYGAGLNVPVQGSAAEIILCSLVRFNKVRQKNFLLVTAVHDEIVIEAPEAEAEEASKLLINCMTKGFLDVFPKGVTTNLVNAKIGDNWGQCK